MCELTMRECFTGLHDRRSREYNPITPVEGVSLSSRTHSCVPTFITHILCINGIEMDLVSWISYTLVTYFSTSQFASLCWWIWVKQVICRDATTWRVWRAVRSLPCYDGDSTQRQSDATSYCDVTQCMHWFGILIFTTESPKADWQTQPTYT